MKNENENDSIGDDHNHNEKKRMASHHVLIDDTSSDGVTIETLIAAQPDSRFLI